MKVAVSTDGNCVSAHFGRCPEYTIFFIEDGKVKSKTKIPNPGHEPGFLPGYLGKMGINCIICGGMGPRAQDLFAQQNIKTMIGIEGLIDEVINAYIKGELKSGVSTCDHSAHGHEIGHEECEK